MPAKGRRKRPGKGSGVLGKLSIYITTYNRVKYLQAAIESILCQTFADFDLFVLDNCSTDGTEQLVSSIQDPRLHYIRHRHNIGGAANLNYAFEKCSSEYFCVFHDDDIIHDTLIQKEITYMEQNKACSAISCLSNQIDETGKIIRQCTHANNGIIETYSGTEFFSGYIGQQRSFTFPATMYRNGFIKANKITLNAKAGPCMDVVLYMDIEKSGGVLAELQEPLIDYRIHSQQGSTMNLETMLIQLIQYLNQDSYYAALMKQKNIEKQAYYRWYSQKLFIRVASKAITSKTAVKYLKEMRTELNGAAAHYWAARIILSLENVFPKFFEYAYKKIKQKRTRVKPE